LVGERYYVPEEDSYNFRLSGQKLRQFLAEENNLSSNNESPYNSPLAKGGYKMREWFYIKCTRHTKGF